MEIDLRPDGPHDPEHTKDLGNALHEVVRALNLATAGDGLEYPGDAYSLLGALYMATGGVPQLTVQIARFLDDLKAAEMIRTDDGSSPNPLLARALMNLSNAHAAAAQLTAQLRAAQNAIASLGGTDDHA